MVVGSYWVIHNLRLRDNGGQIEADVYAANFMQVLPTDDDEHLRELLV